MIAAVRVGEETGDPFAGSSDAELLAGIVWRRSAPAGLQRAACRGDLEEFGRRLRARPLFRRAAKRVQRWNDAASGACPPCWQPLWSRHAFESSDRSARLAELLTSWKSPAADLSRKARRRLIQGTVDLGDELHGAIAPDPFEQLGWGTLLLYGDYLPDELFGRLWCAAYGWLHSPAATHDADSAWTADQRLLARGEVPLLFGRLYADVRGARRTAAHGAQRLREELHDLTDRDGTPHARLLERLPLWLAPFVRATHTGHLLEQPWWDAAAQRRFRRLVTQAAALCRSSGQTALSNGDTCAPVSLLRTAAHLAGLKPRHRTTQFLLSVDDDVADLGAEGMRERRRDSGHLNGRQRHRVRTLSRKHRPATQSDWAELACLRNNWGLGADACVIAFDGRVPRIDLTAFGAPVLSGAWEYETRIAAEPAPVVEHWKCVCWFTDGDADFVELQGAAGSHVTFLRQALLSRTDHFLLLNDVVKTIDAHPADLTHSLRLPFASPTAAAHDALTREWQVRAGSLPLRVFPLGLEQRTTEAAAGRLHVGPRGIELTQRGSGGLSCPLLLDWSPVRRDAPAQWRRATVAENGRALPLSLAAGYRLRVGEHQWVYYHSLRPGETARTLLGLHTFYETVVGEFTSAGTIEPIVLVESPANE